MRAFAFAAPLALFSAGGDAAGLDAAIAACRGVVEPSARLACYDATAAASGARFFGRLSAVTETFEIGAPTTLRFESDDAILILYLLDGSGSVVQNLHQAGVGEGRFRIETPGRYQLQVNASGGWRVWLESGF